MRGKLSFLLGEVLQGSEKTEETPRQEREPMQRCIAKLQEVSRGHSTMKMGRTEQ